MARAGSSVFSRSALIPVGNSVGIPVGILVGILVGALALSGCQMATGTGTGADPAMANGAVAATTGPGQRVVERDIEAPEIFQIEEAGLWDGRPSLGGVWVAHPGVDDPERAMIRNAATGATVIGALFRRERENPGPRFQISSEAANALGILPGAPTEIAVTALRLQRVEIELDPVPAPTTAVDETLAIAPVETDAAATATAAAPAGAPTGQVEITAEEPRRRGLFGLFGRREAEPEAAIAQTTLAPAAGAATAAAGATGTAQSAAGAVASIPPTAAAPQPERRRFRDLFRRRAPEPDTTLIALPGAQAPSAQAPSAQAPGAEAAATTAPPSAPPPQSQPQGPRLDRRYVQIGIFSVEQNAINARSQMQRAGLGAEIRRGRVGENLFWRVIVGPAGTSSERGAMLRQVRGMGFADAYAVVR